MVREAIHKDRAGRDRIRCPWNNKGQIRFHRLAKPAKGLAFKRDFGFEPLATLADAHCRRAILLRRTVTILPVSHRAYKLSAIIGHR